MIHKNSIREQKIKKNCSSRKCSLKVQCLIENHYTRKSQNKVIFDKMF